MAEWRGTQRLIRLVTLLAFGAAWLSYLSVLLLGALAAGLFLCCAAVVTALVLRRPIRRFVGDSYAPT